MADIETVIAARLSEIDEAEAARAPAGRVMTGDEIANMLRQMGGRANA